MMGQSGHVNFGNGDKNWRLSMGPRRRQWWLVIVVSFFALFQIPTLSLAQDAKTFDINASNILATAKSFPVPSRYCSAEEKAYTTGFLSGQIQRAKTLRQDVNAAYKGKKSTVAEQAAKQAILTKIRNAQSLLRQKLSKANRLKPEDCSDPGTIGSVGGGGTTKKGGVRGGGKGNETIKMPTLVPLIIPDLPARFCTKVEMATLIRQLNFARGVAQKNLASVTRHDFGKSAAGRAAKRKLLQEQKNDLLIIDSRTRQVQRAKLAPEEECKDPKKPSGTFTPGSGRLQTPGGAGQNEATDEGETPKPGGTESDPEPVPTEEEEILVGTPVTPDPEQDEFDKAVKELEETLEEMSGVGPSFEIPNEEPGEGTEEEQEEDGSPESESRTPTEEVEEEDPEGGGF